MHLVFSRKDKHRGRDSFQDFQEKTSDAWDDGDDDVLALSAGRNNVHSTAPVASSRYIRPEPKPGGNKMAAGILGKNGQNSFSCGGDASHVISSSGQCVTVAWTPYVFRTLISYSRIRGKSFKIKNEMK